MEKMSLEKSIGIILDRFVIYEGETRRVDQAKIEIKKLITEREKYIEQKIQDLYYKDKLSKCKIEEIFTEEK